MGKVPYIQRGKFPGCKGIFNSVTNRTSDPLNNTAQSAMLEIPFNSKDNIPVLCTFLCVKKSMFKANPVVHPGGQEGHHFCRAGNKLIETWVGIPPPLPPPPSHSVMNKIKFSSATRRQLCIVFDCPTEFSRDTAGRLSEIKFISRATWQNCRAALR